MKMFNGEKVELVLTPTSEEMERAFSTAKMLMSEKVDAWILDRLTIEQLEKCISQFQSELKKRTAQQGNT